MEVELNKGKKKLWKEKKRNMWIKYNFTIYTFLSLNILIIINKILSINIKIDDNIVTIISKMLFGVLVLEAYFISTYFLGKNVLSSIETLLPEFNYTTYSESLYIFSDNSQRNLFINPSQTVLNVILFNFSM